MNVYRVTWTNTALDDKIAWCGSMQESTDKAMEVRIDAIALPDITIVEVPTDKTRLIAWLNKHLHTEHT